MSRRRNRDKVKIILEPSPMEIEREHLNQFKEKVRKGVSPCVCRDPRYVEYKQSIEEIKKA